jgi:hypothetical protein
VWFKTLKSSPVLFPRQKNPSALAEAVMVSKVSTVMIVFIGVKLANRVEFNIQKIDVLI